MTVEVEVEAENLAVFNGVKIHPLSVVVSVEMSSWRYPESQLLSIRNIA
jgi:hypothetical protein